MSTRQERQRQKTLLRKEMKMSGVNPARRQLRDREAGRASKTEIYRLDDDGAGKPIYFDISAMRRWAEVRGETYLVRPDGDRVRRFVESGAVELDHIRNYTIKHKMAPIIICRNIGGADQIVDGAHRYVASWMSAQAMNMDVPVEAFVLLAHEWRGFVVPSRLAEQLLGEAPKQRL